MLSNCCNNYGPHQFPEKLIPLIILKGLHEEHIPVYGQGENIRDWIYVDDHARALWVITNSGQVGETYLIGCRSERRNIDVVMTITRMLDELLPSNEGARERLIRFVPDRARTRFSLRHKSRQDYPDLGWRPQENFDLACERLSNGTYHHRQWWGRSGVDSIGASDSA